MKQRFSFVGRTILTAAIVHAIIAGCGSDDNGVTRESQYLKQLSGTWHIERVTVDDEDVTLFFDGLVVTIYAKETFSVLNGLPPYWPQEGGFRLVAADQAESYRLMREDGMDMLITELTAESLRLRLTYAPSSAGRASSVSGEYEFVFERQ